MCFMIFFQQCNWIHTLFDLQFGVTVLPSKHAMNADTKQLSLFGSVSIRVGQLMNAYSSRVM